MNMNLQVLPSRIRISPQSVDYFRSELELLTDETGLPIDEITPEELAKLVDRTPENVNTDIKFLEQLGFVETTKVKEIRKKLVPEVNYDKMTLEISV